MKLASKIKDKNNQILGQKLRARRKDLDLTQSQIALVVGCSPQQIQKYEVGNSNISISVFLKICRALRIHPNRFFSNISFSEEPGTSYNEDLEKTLVAAFRAVENEKVRERIVNLVESLVAVADLEET